MFKILHVRSQIYKKILKSKGNWEKRKSKTATNHHNKQPLPFAPPPKGGSSMRDTPIN